MRTLLMLFLASTAAAAPALTEEQKIMVVVDCGVGAKFSFVRRTFGDVWHVPLVVNEAPKVKRDPSNAKFALYKGHFLLPGNRKVWFDCRASLAEKNENGVLKTAIKPLGVSPR